MYIAGLGSPVTHDIHSEIPNISVVTSAPAAVPPPEIPGETTAMKGGRVDLNRWSAFGESTHVQTTLKTVRSTTITGHQLKRSPQAELAPSPSLSGRRRDCNSVYVTCEPNNKRKHIAD